jgi:hypothetical protein
MTERRPTSRGWYLVAVGLIGCALAIALTGYFQMADSVRGLQRVEMPGRTNITLAAGLTTVYFESRSEVNGQVYELEDAEVACRLADGRGEAVALEPVTARIRYTFASYRGRAIYHAQIPAPGDYTLDCKDTDAIPRYVLAIGGGIGAWIVVAVVGGVIPGLGGIAVALVVFLRRRRQLRSSRS